MAEDSPGEKPNKAKNAAHQRPDKHRSNNGKPDVFEGSVPELKGFIFDVGRSKKDSYMTTMRKIAEHLSREGSNNGEMLNMLDPDILAWGSITTVNPTPAANASIVDFVLWKISLRQNAEETKRRKEMSSKAFAVLLGQCMQALRNTFETYPTYTYVKQSLDAVELAKLIRLAIFSGTTTGKPTMTYVEAEADLLSFKQPRNMSNAEYMDTFKCKVEVYEHLGGEPGRSTHRVDEQLTKMGTKRDLASDAQMDTAKSRAKEEYLSGLLIANCNESRYSTWKIQLEISSLDPRGDPYPTTLAKAFKYLETWDRANQTLRKLNSRAGRAGRRNEQGMAYVTEGYDNDRQSRSHGHGRGRGRGQGGQGRGRNGNRNGKTSNDETHNIAESVENVDESENNGAGIFEPEPSNSSNSRTSDDKYSCYNIKNAQRLSNHLKSTPGKKVVRLLILDSASTIDIIASSTLLHNIHRVQSPIQVNTLTGNGTIHHQGNLGSYLPPVWYHPEGGVNILSLNNVRKYYRVTMDTKQRNEMKVHLSNEKFISFKGSGKGLYQHALTSEETIDSMWSLLTDHGANVAMEDTYSTGLDTVAKRKDMYTSRQQKNALVARNIEDIIMRPGSWKFTDACLPYVKDCPVTAADARAAQDILGHNLGAIKGKTVHHTNPHVHTSIAPVPM